MEKGWVGNGLTGNLNAEEETTPRADLKKMSPAHRQDLLLLDVACFGQPLCRGILPEGGMSVMLVGNAFCL